MLGVDTGPSTEDSAYLSWEDPPNFERLAKQFLMYKTPWETEIQKLKKLKITKNNWSGLFEVGSIILYQTDQNTLLKATAVFFLEASLQNV